MAKLFLIPTVLSDAPLNNVLPSGNTDIIKQLRYFIVENIRTARRFLKQVDKTINIDELTFFELNQHTPATEVEKLLQPLLNQNHDMGIISEAGCPAVADPGADVVAIAQRHHVTIVPLVGPSSILLSVMGSGFNGQSFAFNGYLPIEHTERQKRLKTLERRAYTEDQTQIFIETPYRNLQLFQEMCTTLQPNTRLCIACNLTAESQSIVTRTIAQWRQQTPETIHKIPTIFLIYKA
ncbi:MAG: SAM-dependent methyltransferase [Bacteroidales bacterium]|nr:SAM-dependent methyltransferase [Bacteroidales bacterium]